jgi:hypothetical protein
MGKAARKTSKRVAPKRAAKAAREIYEAENVNHPGTTHRVDAAKYKLARAAMLAFLPKRPPGMTQSEMSAAMRKATSRAEFPGTTSSWWMKTVQLDLEAKGLVVRDKTKPLTWRKV